MSSSAETTTSTTSNDPSHSQLDSNTQEPDIVDQPTTPDSSTFRPFRVYTKQDLLYLAYSPMINCPANMPELKVWFGYAYFRPHIRHHHS